jgi:hypothetical protein
LAVVGPVAADSTRGGALTLTGAPVLVVTLGACGLGDCGPLAEGPTDVEATVSPLAPLVGEPVVPEPVVADALVFVAPPAVLALLGPPVFARVVFADVVFAGVVFDSGELAAARACSLA